MARIDKGSKKVAKEVDPFFAFIGTIQKWGVRYWQYLLIGGVILLVAFGVAYSVHYLKASREESAWTAYFNVKIETEKGEHASFEDVAIQHAGTVAGRLASLITARDLFREGKYNDALEYVERAKETGEPLMDFPLELLKAKILAKLGRNNEALKIYENLMVSENGIILGVDPYVQASIIYFRAGNSQAAVNTLQQGMMKFKEGGQIMALLLSSFMRMMGLGVVSPSELF